MSYNATMLLTLQRIIALVLVCIVAPIFLLIALITLMDSGWPIIYRQRRLGRDRKGFLIWKFRTMKKGAHSEQKKYNKLNEADGPVFKIRNDPRFTRFGKWLSWSGLDELPQLFNVIRGEMVLVGPRPLPVTEAESVPKKYESRFSVLPGITSTWVVKGAHRLSFKEWMKLDIEYVKDKSVKLDIKIVAATVVMMMKLIFEFIEQIGLMIYELIMKYRWLLLILVVGGGAVIRFMRMINEQIWNDEMFYLSVAREHSFKDLITTNHWIIDHPPLYFLQQFFLSQISTESMWLRVPNLIFYVISSYFIYRIGLKLFKSPLNRLLLNLIYAFFPYFVSMEWQAIPYAMTITFFLMSFYYCWSMIRENDTRSVWLASLFTTLFFYTSFEAGYYIASLLVFWISSFQFVEKSVRLKMLAFFWLTFVLLLPELWILLGNFNDFASLSTHWLKWRWQGEMMIRDVYAINNFSIALVFIGVGISYLIFQMINDRLVRLKILFLLTLIGGFFMMLWIVSNFFFYASNPKAYYYLFFLIWMLLLGVIEWGQMKYRKKFTVAVVIILISSISWFYPTKSWVKADYLYIANAPSPYILRDKLMTILKEDSSWVVLTDQEMGGDDELEGYYLDHYYLECLDMVDSADCLRIKDSRRTVSEVSRKRNLKVIGILTDTNSQRYFEKGLCVSQAECLMWNFKLESFIKVK